MVQKPDMIMKVLWLSSANTLFDEKGDRSYNGKGWIASLQDAVRQYAPHIRLAVAFLSAEDSGATVQDGVTYYKIRRRTPSGLRKLLRNWGGGGQENYDDRIREVADDFRPDLIQVFGCETKLASAILSIKDIPVIVHIQGILNECLPCFFPPGFRPGDMVIPSTFTNEKILRNGYIHLYEDYRLRAAREKEYLSVMHYAAGRTSWDKEAVRKYSSATYFHIDEVLRPAFYRHAGEGCTRAGNRPMPGKRTADETRISSTISPVPYKGLDLILRTAARLKRDGRKIIWDVAGITPDSDIVRIFEKKTGIRAAENGIRFRGILDEDQLAEMLLASCIYVHPSYMDNSPNSVCEAQMLGIPVAATDAGGTTSLVQDGITGKIVGTGDSAAMAEAIAYYMDHPQEAAATAKAAASAAASRHDRSKIVSGLLSAYCSITGLPY